MKLPRALHRHRLTLFKVRAEASRLLLCSWLGHTAELQSSGYCARCGWKCWYPTRGLELPWAIRSRVSRIAVCRWKGHRVKMDSRGACIRCGSDRRPR